MSVHFDRTDHGKQVKIVEIEKQRHGGCLPDTPTSDRGKRRAAKRNGTLNA
jgi:hypothetical protein